VVIDYRAERFEERAADVDLVLDLVGGETLDRSWAVLAPRGVVVSTAAPDVAARAPEGRRGVWLMMRADAEQLRGWPTRWGAARCGRPSPRSRRCRGSPRPSSATAPVTRPARSCSTCARRRRARRRRTRPSRPTTRGASSPSRARTPTRRCPPRDRHRHLHHPPQRARDGGRYALIDMHVPSGGGPPPHRHDFEEMFTVLAGEIEVTFRGETLRLRAGETVNVPANAPHAFRVVSDAPARLLCMCTPAGPGGVLRRGRGAAADAHERSAPARPGRRARTIARTLALAPKYRSELTGS
jgi:quercetin dioxygenase-like cupin family protein